MNHKDENTKLTAQAESLETLEPELREALGNFKASVDSWSSCHDEPSARGDRRLRAPTGAR